MASQFDDFVNEATLQVLRAGIAAVNDTVLFAEDRARYYVPVRAIFRRSRRGPRLRSLILREDMTPAQVMTAYRRNTISTAKQYEAFQRSLPRYRRIIVPSAASGLVTESGRTSVTGHANTERPVIRFKRVTTTGDFRRAEMVGGKPTGRLAAVPYAFSNRGGPARVVTASPDRIASAILTSSGRYEVKSGRANVVRDTGDVQVGGTLKRSIKAELASLSSMERGVYWGYVRAGGGAKYPDGTSVAFVARMQEYGSAHNRPHPFLRPALYESRARFRAAIEAHMGPIIEE